jgi:hypothetical protein
MALLPGSAAIDQVPASGAGCPATDQRGVARPAGPACDIGAFDAAAPRNLTAPAITGSASVGSALMYSTGTWANLPQSYAFEWRRDGIAIAGAAASTYVVGVADAGHRLSCWVTATNQTGSATADSAAVGVPVPPVHPSPPSQRPTISGLALHPSMFPAATRGASIAKGKHRATGTTISYRDSLGATTTLAVLRTVSGMRKGRSCVKRTRKAKHPERCTRDVSLGSFSHVDNAGRVSFHFSGRVGGGALSPGSYLLSAVPRAGQTAGMAATAGFQIKR